MNLVRYTVLVAFSACLMAGLWLPQILGETVFSYPSNRAQVVGSTGVGRDGGCHLRAGPSKASKSIRHLPKAEYPLLWIYKQRKGGWRRVEVEHTMGWVHRACFSRVVRT